MKVFFILRVDQIDLKKIFFIGVVGLKYFFEYVGKGIGVLNYFYVVVFEEVEMGELIVVVFCEKGYQVKIKIGCFGFKVDVGIIDFNDIFCYMFGILCDGENYWVVKIVWDREIV